MDFSTPATTPPTAHIAGCACAGAFFSFLFLTPTWWYPLGFAFLGTLLFGPKSAPPTPELGLCSAVAFGAAVSTAMQGLVSGEFFGAFVALLCMAFVVFFVGRIQKMKASDDMWSTRLRTGKKMASISKASMQAGGGIGGGGGGGGGGDGGSDMV